MFELRELHLQTPFTALRAGAEDIENELRAVEHGKVHGALDVALLRGRERDVEDEAVGLGLLGELSEFLDLPRPEEGGGIGFGALGLHEPDGLEPARGHEKSQFVGRVGKEGSPEHHGHKKSARRFLAARFVNLKDAQLSSPENRSSW